MNTQKLTQYEPIVLGIVRIMTGLLFLEHGAQKFLSFPPGEYAGSGWAFAQLGAYAGPIELICGFLVAIGWFTRRVASPRAASSSTCTTTRKPAAASWAA